MSTPVDIGPLLVASRVSQGLTQRELARRVGVTQPQIARWEAGEYRSASLNHVDEVARALGVTVVLPACDVAAEAPTTYAGECGLSIPAAGALSRLGVHTESIAAFCRQHGIVEMALFGSVVRTDFGDHSDVDVLASWSEDRRPADIGSVLDTEAELSAIFRRRVDLIDSADLLASPNRLRRDRILRETEVVYVAR
jgi:predicted nucleotidyltransferase/DNA-binding XRE family transcriptional regulator